MICRRLMSGKETSDVNRIKAGIFRRTSYGDPCIYETAFPAGEKKPFSMIISGQETGLVEILSAEENDTFLGLAIMAKSGDRVLLTTLPSRLKEEVREPVPRCCRR